MTIIDSTRLDHCIGYAYLISSIDPLEARLIMETEYARAIKKIDSTFQGISDVVGVPQDMCSLDLDRALEMIDSIESKLKIPDIATDLRDQLMQYLLMSGEERVAVSSYVR